MTNLCKAKLPLRGFLPIASNQTSRLVAREAVPPQHFHPLTIALAVAATATSLCVAAYSGWERGDTYVERATYTALAVVIASGVHLLPAMSQQRPLVVRIALSLLCVAGLAVTLGGQAEFFALAQQHAGARRADTVPAVASLSHLKISSSRSLAAIAADQASARKALAVINDQSCHVRCKDLRTRRAVLAATLDELDTEANEAKRREVADDRQAVLADHAMRLRDEMRDDPVVTRLAALTGLAGDRVGLLLSLVCAGVLDGIGVVAWYLVFAVHRTGDRDSVMSVESDDLAVVARVVHGPEAESKNRALPPIADRLLDTRLTQLTRAVADGQVKMTVAGIRNYLGCAQGTAIKLRRELLAQCTSQLSTDGEV
ncbi:hypothetical protein [Paraburkholderia sp. MM5384-R2]|uniref:hypothetical protein n=1 Tax=Paraburkholderia sp. MM5384-R2 TaxID=2723097 RepID=UPI001607D0A4|nr:hypothetical protein [Paraburkholderia sp. MM5384-R2]MBB5501042.1 hypothetical protein [Paraburkholderia sp. MM5384-R2]